MTMNRNLEINRSIIALNQLKGIGQKRVKIILESVVNPNNTHFLELVEMGIKQNILSRNTAVGVFLDAVERADKIMELCEQANIQIINSFSPDFPETLRFDESPDLIYYRGDLSILSSEKRAAVIGTRRPSYEGAKFAYQAGRCLAEKGYTVISGLALGCDTAGHGGCLDAGGKTVAFLPSNISNLTPKENETLAARIVDNGGCLVSQYSPFDVSNAYMYIERDRLQAYLSQFIVVSEFARNSGTLHTLEFAHDFGREIYTHESIIGLAPDGYSAMREEGIPYQTGNWEELGGLILKNHP